MNKFFLRTSSLRSKKIYGFVIFGCIFAFSLPYYNNIYVVNERYYFRIEVNKFCLENHQTFILLQNPNNFQLPVFAYPIIKMGNFGSREEFSVIIHEVMEFMKENNCIRNVIVLNSDSSIVKRNYSFILDEMASTSNLHENLLVNKRLKNMTMYNILKCIYNAEQSQNCETLQPLITCQHSSAIVQYLYHSHEHIVNGQPSITIGFEKFESESILQSDFIIMKSGLSESHFLVTYRSPFYVHDNKLQLDASFDQTKVSIVPLSGICRNPSFRSNIIETVVYKSPKNHTPSKFYKLDDEKLECNLEHRFKDINIDVEPIRNVLLIMELRFNESYATIKKLVDILYSPFFTHIIYCAPEINGVETIFEDNSYFNSTLNSGFTSYECLTKAVRCGFQLDGYILLSDDTILQPWSFERNHLSSLYLQESIVPKMNFNDKHAEWPPWNSLRYGASFLIKAIKQLRTEQDEDIKRFLTQYDDNLKEMGFQSYSDFVYLPSTYASTYMKIGEVLAKYGVFLEIATPYIFHGLTKMENVKHITNGKYFQVASSLGMKQSYVNLLKYDNVVFHPIKLTKIKVKNSVYDSLFCKYLENFQIFLLKMHKNML